MTEAPRYKGRPATVAGRTGVIIAKRRRKGIEVLTQGDVFVRWSGDLVPGSSVWWDEAASRYNGEGRGVRMPTMRAVRYEGRAAGLAVVAVHPLYR